MIGGYPTKSDTQVATMPPISQSQTAFDGVWQRIKPGTAMLDGGEVDFEINVESNSDVVNGNGTVTLDCELVRGTGIVTGSKIEASGTMKETNVQLKETGEILNDGETIMWSNDVTWRRRTHTKAAGAPSWTVVIVPDDTDIKARRGVPTLKVSEFCKLVSQHSVNAPCYITAPNGLNDWPGFADMRLKLERLEYPSVQGPLTGHIYGTTKWDMHDVNTLEDWCKNQKGITARLRTDDDVGRGWASNSPGFAFWYTPGELRRGVAEFELQGKLVVAGQPRVAFGTDMLKALDLENNGQVTKATKAYYWAHRYCTANVGLRDMVTYHVFVQVEWDNLPNTTTVFELAWRQGLSAYKGQSNFFEDWGGEEHKGSRTEMAVAMESHGSAMLMPWRPTLAEIRIIDIPKSASEFKKYMDKYGTEDPGEQGKRFLKVAFQESTVRLVNRSRADLMKAILSYIRQDRSYSETTRNCQHFGADFFSYLTGKDVGPYSAISRAFVWDTPKQNLARFLYDADLH